jgi:hypothetical protein
VTCPHRIVTRLVALAALLAALTACAGNKNKDKDEANILPTKFKDQIELTLTTTLGDPTNIRGAYYSEPVLDLAGPIKTYYSCVRFNARGTDGDYMGSRDYIAYYYGGELNQLVGATPEQCGKAAYKPYPELEKLCLGASCK